ncbi:MAG: hypothetical protein A2359_03865 [Candidatus Moranbacteria bacterium RIFOXYB1_FULL_43_19]|nr:MAG: hypothetical protein A2359_03865 [Candidatus Moranbacteria bacterium RIFOXYB1_FULL_43_19]OGI34000.1 MAG: hypothetical protein A2420_02555 [Candidatus Moranbacteria bacterium RIFOXYC1_FULL_44_13]OGI37713.1 MAG: hypothetical protein A2612_03050 [Candidatus Moranbacteria bacterium RIFOXYD1_FULL_44_12]
METQIGAKMPVSQLLTNAFVTRGGKPFLASAIGVNVTICPVDRAGRVIGKKELLPAGEFYLEVIHPDDLRKFSGR